MRLGSRLKKLHRVLEFNHSQWLKPYIEFYTQKKVEVRRKSENDRKELYKLINKAVYSQTTKNIRN